MNFRRTLFLFLFFMLILSIKTFANEPAEINIEEITNSFNENEYVKNLKEHNYNIYAVEMTNRFTIKYNKKEITYIYDPVTNIFRVEMELLATDGDLELLNALFIDTLYTMQGSGDGYILGAALSDYYCSTSLEEDGIIKEYITLYTGESGISFKINPFIKFSVPDYNTPIPRANFATYYSQLIDDTNTFIYYEDLVALKYIDDNGKTVIYIGEPKSNTHVSKESVKNLIDLLFGKKAAYYFDNAIVNLSSNSKAPGIEITSNLDSLPLLEKRSLIIPKNLIYSKIVIDDDAIKKQAEQMPDIDDGENQTKNRSNSSVPLISAIVVIVLSIIIILFGILKRHLDNN